MQVGADTCQLGSTNDPPEMAILAAEAQPSSSHIVHARTETRSDTATFPSDTEPMYVAAHSYVSPSIIAEVAPSSIVYRPSTAGQRQVKSSVPAGIDEPSFGLEREKSQSGMAGFESHRVVEPRPTSIATGHPLSEGVVRPSPVHARPTPTQTPTSMSTGLMPAAHTVYPSGVDVYAARPTLADDEPAMRQYTPAYTGQYAAVCTGLQVQTTAETLTAQSLLLLGRCPTSPQSSPHSSVQEWLETSGARAPPATPVGSISSSGSELQQLVGPPTQAPVVVPPSVRSSRVSRTSRMSRHSASSSLAMEIFGFAREMSGQTTQLVGQMQAQAQVYQDQSQNQINLIFAQAEAHKQESRRREEIQWQEAKQRGGPACRCSSSAGRGQTERGDSES